MRRRLQPGHPEPTPRTEAVAAPTFSELVSSTGEVGRLLAEKDWTDHALGPMSGWPLAFRSRLMDLLLAPSAAMLFWGPDFFIFYNDALLVAPGATGHPSSLGRPVKELTAVWSVVGAEIEAAYERRPHPPVESGRILLDRTVPQEEFYLRRSYRPVTDQHGAVLGVWADPINVTRQALAERRLRVLVSLAQSLAQSPPAPDPVGRTIRIMRDNVHDHPFVAAYAFTGREIDAERSDVPDDAPPALRVSAERLAVAIHEAGSADGEDGYEATSDATVGGLHAHRLPGHEPLPTVVIVVGHSRHRPWDGPLQSYVGACLNLLRKAQRTLSRLTDAEAGYAASRQSEEARSRFLMAISHELRTPLSLISAPVGDLLGDPYLPPRLIDRVRLVDRNVERLTRLVEGILELSRASTERIVPEIAPIEVNDVVATIVDDFVPLAAHAGLSITVVHDADEVTALADRVMVEQILINLLANAVHYTTDGGITVRVGRDDAAFVVDVTDTGRGIPAADLERIFQSHERLATDAAPPGWGIGLALVRALSRLLGGDVTVTSEVGRGSTFRLSLPLHPAVPDPAVPDPRAPERAVVEPTGDDAALAPIRLVLAEDDPDLAGYLTDALSTDYAVEAYGDGAAALAAIRRQPPDIVLTDVVMPGLDGHALVAAIRNDPALAPLPVVMLSARASRDDILSGLGHRADHYVPKPFVLAELKARLAGCLALAQVRSADAAWRRSIMSAFHDPVLIADPTGDVLEANTAFLRLVGRTASPQPGHQPWWSEPDERTQWTDAVATAMAQGSVAGEFLLRRRDRQTVRVAGRLSRVDVRGGPSRVLATLRDVTRERESQRRRAAAARIVADLHQADDLAHALTTAHQGLRTVFDGEPFIVVRGMPPETAMGREGLIPVGSLPSRVREILTRAAPMGHGSPDVGTLRRGVELSTRTGVRGWIQFPRPRVLNGEEQIIADLLAQSLDLAVDRLLAAQSFQERRVNLERAVESNRLVGQAVGILVERHRITSDAAFERLRRASQEANVKLSRVAERVVETGQEPLPRAGRPS